MKKKWLIGGLCVALVALLAYVAAGPYLAVNGIRNVVASGNYGKLPYFVDFERLRDSVTPQIQTRIRRDIQQRLGTGKAASVASEMTTMISQPTINAIVSPLGVATLLTGTTLAHKLTGKKGPDGRVHAIDPLKDARTHYESLSRFTATVTTDEAKPLVFVFERNGINWKLTGLRLPD
ncbi:MAG: DUF2939 domain-containing protein [Thermomonas sp.]